MPLIFTKDNDNNKLCAITTRLLTKKLKPKTSSNISSPGFVHENANILNEPQKTIDFQRNSEICPSLTGKMTAVSNEVVPENSEISSIISNSRKLQELKALHTLLKNIPTERNNKSPPPFPPRKPTLESIKEAIEKTKRLNENKNVETENNKSTIIAMSDASTSIEHRKTKLKKREASADSHVTGVRSSPTTRNNSETRRKKKKTFKKSQETSVMMHSCLKK